MEYNGYTILEEPAYPIGSRWMYYKTSEGLNHDQDLIGDDWTYVGNCKWASTLEDAKAEIDELLTETI